MMWSAWYKLLQTSKSYGETMEVSDSRKRLKNKTVESAQRSASRMCWQSHLCKVTPTGHRPWPRSARRMAVPEAGEGRHGPSSRALHPNRRAGIRREWLLGQNAPNATKGPSLQGTALPGNRRKTAEPGEATRRGSGRPSCALATRGSCGSGACSSTPCLASCPSELTPEFTSPRKLTTLRPMLDKQPPGRVPLTQCLCRSLHN